VERFVSEPIRIAAAEEDDPIVSRADLVLFGVDHSGDSYEGRVFLNNPDADVDTPRDPAHGYAGSFTVFGHGGCYGEEGHCDPGQRTTDAFDRRPPHPLTPFTKTVVVSEALRRVTVVRWSSRLCRWCLGGEARSARTPSSSVTCAC
jgi:tyrosinase